MRAKGIMLRRSNFVLWTDISQMEPLIPPERLLQPERRNDRVDIVVSDEAPESVHVIDCHFSTFDPDAMATHYRIDRVVGDESAGMQLFLNVLQHEGLDMRIARQSGP